MSSSKMTKRGQSQYIDSWNPKAKRYIVSCSICGAIGYSPTIDEDGFSEDNERAFIASSLREVYSPLSLDEYGRCEVCSRLMDEGE